MTKARDTANIIDLPNAKGDLLVATGPDVLTNVTVGTNGQALIADSTQATGVKWGEVASDPTADIFMLMGA